MANEFGFTNDDAEIARVEAWRDAAVADGWSIEPTYKHEDASRTSSLTRDGFKAMVLTRRRDDTKGKWKYETKVTVWGPDGLAIPAGDTYDFATLKAWLRRCPVCNADGIETHRYSFAGRCCEACLPHLRAKYEKPGWCD